MSSVFNTIGINSSRDHRFAGDCRATWVYEAVVRPTLTTLQAEIQKVPAFERMLHPDDAHTAGQARRPRPLLVHSPSVPC